MQVYGTPGEVTTGQGWSPRRLLSHFGEMVLAMFIGMSILDAVWAGVLAALGTSTADVLDTAPALVALVLMFNMTAPMLLWMRHRGHPTAQVAEMAVAMASVGLGAVVLLWASAIDSTGICGLECSLMIVVMAAVMWVRRREY